MKKLFVNEARFDDVGKVLIGLGKGFEFFPIAGLLDAEPSDAVVFINCGGGVPFSYVQLRQFVESGGTIYASDLQAPLVAQLYPAVLRAAPGGSAGTVNACVTDQGLRAIIGSDIQLQFDMGGWQCVIPNASKEFSVRTYIEADTRPLLISCQPPSGGTVFFTAFHNVKQTSQQEMELMRFLIFRPIMSAAIRDSANALASQSFTIEREYTGGLRKDISEREFEVPFPGVWTTRLSWSGQGKVGLQLIAPERRILAECEGWTSPLEIVGVAAPAGSRVRIRYIDFVQKELPFCVHVASGAAPRETSALRGSLLRAPLSKREEEGNRSPGITGTLANLKRK